MIYSGTCHCEAIGFQYETALTPSDWPMRACGCRFCRTHGAVTTSDPGGALELVCREPGQLMRYRFGLGTADFWVCRGCGVYVGAATSDGRFGLVNTNALIDRHPALPPPRPMSYDGETAAARMARRAQRWTPLKTTGTWREEGL
jgi:hypothetical protein